MKSSAISRKAHGKRPTKTWSAKKYYFSGDEMQFSLKILKFIIKRNIACYKANDPFFSEVF